MRTRVIHTMWCRFNLLVLLIAIAVFCNAFTPFKNRGNGAGTYSGGVMMNTALPTQSPASGLGSHTHVHGHQQHQHQHQHSSSPRPPAYIFGDKYHLYQTPNYHHPHHFHYSSLHVQTNKRQIRNPFDVIYEWRQLDFEYPTFLDRQRAILSGEFIPTNNLVMVICSPPSITLLLNFSHCHSH